MAKGNSYQGITPDRKNANKGTERGRYMVEASLRETGAGRSIVLDKDGRIIAGNKTFEAASDIGLPVRIVETDGRELVAVKRTDLDLDDDTGTARKLAYYDNRAGQVGLEWDAEIMLGDIGAGLDLSAMFRQDELDELLADLTPKTTGDTEPQTDRAEELREKWNVQPGQLWQLGEHRLICGDCTDAATVARVMGGDDGIDLIVTDPPFAITGSATGAEDMSGVDIMRPFYRLWIGHFASLLHLFGHAYICCDFRSWSMIDGAANGALYLKNCIVWYKGGGGLGSMYQNCHELVWFGVRQERRRIKSNKTGQRTITGQPNVWQYTPPTYQNGPDAPLHTANKPLEMFVRMIENSSDPGDIVAEPFSGSGTTIIACENLSRRCRAVEISAAYVAVALQRWADHTQRTPVLLTD